MAEMADYYLEGHMREVEHFERFKDCDDGTLYEEGLINEQGISNGTPHAIDHQKDIYTCPTCGGHMKSVSGVYGVFMGCKAFPKCHGSICI